MTDVIETLSRRSIASAMGCDLGYVSHAPILAAALTKIAALPQDFPVVEFGCGWGSTPLLHYGAGPRPVITMDSDLDWLRRFVAGYRSRTHRFVFVKPSRPRGVKERMDAWAAVDLPDEIALAFVDQAPGEARVPLVRRLRGRAKLVVCHDTEADDPPGGGNYRWRDLEGVFRYADRMRRLRPNTTAYTDDAKFRIQLEACDR